MSNLVILGNLPKRILLMTHPSLLPLTPPPSRHSFASSPKPNNNTSTTTLLSLNKQISHLIRTGRISEAKLLFDSTPHHRNTVTYNSLLSAFVKLRQLTPARHLFDQIPHPDTVSFNILISAYLSSRLPNHIAQARTLFDQMPARDIISWNTMISGYAKNAMMREALSLFQAMPEPNVVTWNAMVTGLLQNGDLVRAVEFFERMPRRDGASLSALVSGMIKNGKVDEAERTVLKYGGKGEDLVSACNTLIAGYGQKGRVEEARRVFDRIPKFERNVVSWNSMIMCYVKAGDVVYARDIFEEMIERDTISWNTMISGYVNMSDMEEASKLFLEMPNPDTMLWNSMILGYSQVGRLNLAHEFFERMPQKSLISWNSMIAGYEKNEDFKGAAKLFAQMLLEGKKPDRHTLSSVLSVCTGLEDLHLGMQIHQLVTKLVIADLPINNSVITMYSRCGAIEEAQTIFDEMKQEKDVISWNAMIGGYASHGFAAEALELFTLMKGLKVQPTYITFIAVLNACAHAGLVEEGRRQLKSMISDFGIEPRIEHYALLVDTMGRHGQLEEAMDVINNMPFEADKAVWGAMLSACRVHNNVGLGKVAAEALMRLEPESSAPYVLLYNMYADTGLWDEAAAVRLLMDNNKIIKHRGYSRVDSSS